MRVHEYIYTIVIVTRIRNCSNGIESVCKIFATQCMTGTFVGVALVTKRVAKGG